MNFWQAFQASRMCVDHLASDGIALEVVNDFSAVHDLVNESGKGYLTPWLDPRKSVFTSNSAFWLVGRRGSELVVMGGARIDDVGRESPDFIKSLFDIGYGPDCVRSVSGEIREQVSGRAAYFGDLVSRSSKSLGRRNVRYFVAIAHYIAAVNFQADCVYSFMRGADVLLGSADRNGFDGRNRQPLVWGSPPEGRGDREQLVFRRRSDNDRYFATIIQELACRQSGSNDVHLNAQLAIRA